MKKKELIHTNVRFEPKVWDKLLEYKNERELSSITAAICELIDRGLRYVKLIQKDDELYNMVNKAATDAVKQQLGTIRSFIAKTFLSAETSKILLVDFLQILEDEGYHIDVQEYCDDAKNKAYKNLINKKIMED
jgi:hypothetical protein